VASIVERLNDRRDAAGDAGEDAGFTLIELMVVLLILAILLAIALPTFLGVTGGANDRAAQSDLNTALTTAKSAATQNDQAYGGGSAPVTQALLEANVPSINWLAPGTAATLPGQVSWYISDDGNGIVLADVSKNNNACWYASDNLTTVAPLAAPNADAIYGAAPGTNVGTATAAPVGPGTWYSEVLQGAANNNCNAANAPGPNGFAASGGGFWRTHGFN